MNLNLTINKQVQRLKFRLHNEYSMTRRHVLVSKKTKFFTNSFAVLKILLKDLNLLVLLKVTSDTIPIIMASHKDVFCCKLLLDWTFTVPVEGMSLFPRLHLQHHQQTSLPILPKRNDTQIMHPKKSWKHPCPGPHQINFYFNTTIWNAWGGKG